MKKILILIKEFDFEKSDYDNILVIDEKLSNENNILCFFPNKQPLNKSKEFLCFIPYGPNAWQYRQNSRGVGYELGDDKFHLLDTNITYQIHHQVGLRHNEELSILMVVIGFLIKENYEITLSHKIKMNKKEEIYLNKLIDEKSIKVLNV